MRGLCQFLVGLLLLATLAGCGLSPRDERAAWRGEAEKRCLAAGYVRTSPYIVAMREIDGPGTCGMERPFKVSALNAGTLAVKPAAVLACPVIAHFEAWLRDRVQPAAIAYFGQPVTTVQVMAAYGCRTRNNRRGAKLSEHSFGNGVDVGGFVLADGRVVKVVSGWKGPIDEQAFLRRIFDDACDRFTTVLAPGSDAFHYNHFHLDLARHDARGLRHYCRPKLPKQPPLPAPGQLISQARPAVPPVAAMLAQPQPQATPSYGEPVYPAEPSMQDLGSPAAATAQQSWAPQGAYGGQSQDPFVPGQPAFRQPDAAPGYGADGPPQIDPGMEGEAGDQ
jgi:hypothetical protein